jgi:predicted RNA-binding protein associated with RNAse of E/G family
LKDAFYILSSSHYYSEDEEYKGTYVNVNAFMEIYLDRIRYVDLETDLSLPDGRTRVVDQRELEEMIPNEYVSKKLSRSSKRRLKNF